MTLKNAIETPRPRKEKMALDEMKKMDVEPPAAKPLLALEYKVKHVRSYKSPARSTITSRLHINLSILTMLP